MKSAEEIMNVLEAYDLTGSYRDAAELVDAARQLPRRNPALDRSEMAYDVVGPLRGASCVRCGRPGMGPCAALGVWAVALLVW